MRVLDNIKKRLSDFSFKRCKSPSREVKAINIKNAKTIGIVYRSDDDEVKELIERYVKFLKGYNAKVKTLGFYNLDELPRYVTPKLEYDYFVKKSLNWSLESNAIEVENFIQQEFDILIDATVQQDDILRFVTKQSKAVFKVGAAGVKSVEDLDFAINLKTGEGTRQLMKGLDNYLHLINKN
ncbi:hypothetical protein N9Q76_03405 [Flavobacteriales bacterium]|mgnify:FL=1|nr:hypothetical protein [Flavobacteriales bacterium]